MLLSEGRNRIGTGARLRCKNATVLIVAQISLGDLSLNLSLALDGTIAGYALAPADYCSGLPGQRRPARIRGDAVHPLPNPAWLTLFRHAWRNNIAGRVLGEAFCKSEWMP